MSQFERFACIDRLLREHGSVRTAEVAERFEVSPRQIKRDIEFRADLESHLARNHRPVSKPISCEFSLAEHFSVESGDTSDGGKGVTEISGGTACV